MNRLFGPLARHRKLFIVGTHVIVFALSLAVAFQLRFDFAVPDDRRELLRVTLPMFVAVKLVAFMVFRQYAGWWRYVTLSDLMAIVRASLVSAITIAGLIYMIGLREYPRSIFVLDAVVTIGLLSLLRVAIRLYRERFMAPGVDPSAIKRTLIVGTGTTAEELLREAARNPSLALRPVGVITGDATMVGSRFHDVPILGTVGEVEQLVREFEVQQVISAVDAGHGDDTRQVVAACRSADVRHRVLPPKTALLDGTVSISNIREVSLQDLLGRPPVRLDSGGIARMINGATVLVTGAGGSIGSEICRQVARFGPNQLVMLEQAEYPLFMLERELRHQFENIRLEPVIADVYDADRVAAVLAEFEPRLVLHAAAHKHVPLMEMNPSEAVKNNIIGTLNVVRAAQGAGAEVAVLISTDKAVNPTSVMGAAKRIAEMIVQGLAPTSSTKLCAVRFGNVLGSNGSVIPIFQSQIQAGGPVTVTHPEMQRYFMTIPEATQLVLQAATYAEGGDIFLLDMGEPVKIVDVARDLIRLSGLEPGRDIEIVFSGIRPGEKLFEELSTDQEVTDATKHDRIFLCKITPPDAENVLAASVRLEELAGSAMSPPRMRAAIFDVLEVLEQRGSREDIDTAANKIVNLHEHTGRHAALPSEDDGAETTGH